MRKAETKQDRAARLDRAAKMQWLYSQLLPVRNHMGTGLDQAWEYEKDRKKRRSKEDETAYNNSEHGKKTQAAYQNSEHGKNTVAAYRNSEQGKKTIAAYKNSEHGKKTIAAYDNSEHRKKSRAAWKERHARVDPTLVNDMAEVEMETPELKAEVLLKYVISKQPVLVLSTPLAGKKEDLRRKVIRFFKQYRLSLQSDSTLKFVWCDTEYFSRPAGTAQQIPSLNNTIYELALAFGNVSTSSGPCETLFD
jgi:hypothetical protein